MVEPANTITILEPPFDRHPQPVFPFRILCPPLLDGSLQVWPTVFRVGIMLILFAKGVKTTEHTTKAFEPGVYGFSHLSGLKYLSSFCMVDVNDSSFCLDKYSSTLSCKFWVA